MFLWNTGDLRRARLRRDDRGAADRELHDGRDGGYRNWGEFKFMSSNGPSELRREMWPLHDITVRNESDDRVAGG